MQSLSRTHLQACIVRSLAQATDNRSIVASKTHNNTHSHLQSGFALDIDMHKQDCFFIQTT